MNPPRLFIDEDIYGEVAPQLRYHGYDAVSVIESHRPGLTDNEQLHWAIAEGRTMVSFNVGDFARMHAEILSQGGHHPGIVVSAQLPLRIVLRKLLQFMGTLTAAEMYDRLEYLSNW